MARVEQPKLQPGDACWLLQGVLLYETTVTASHVYLEGDPSEFMLYSVDEPSHLRPNKQHREDLFLRPGEIEELRKRIESNIDSLNYMLNDLEDVGVVVEEGE